MSGIGGFKGVSADQDARFSNKQKKLMKSMKFPKELDLKVEPSKVNWVVMFEWVAKRVTELLGVEDEVLIHFIHNKLQAQKVADARELHIDLVPFLEKNTSLFMKELWAMLASASTTASGIPQQILDQKAEELRKKKEIQDKRNEAFRLQRERDREGAQPADGGAPERRRRPFGRERPSRWGRERSRSRSRSRSPQHRRRSPRGRLPPARSRSPKPGPRSKSPRFRDRRKAEPRQSTRRERDHAQRDGRESQSPAPARSVQKAERSPPRDAHRHPSPDAKAELTVKNGNLDNGRGSPPPPGKPSLQRRSRSPSSPEARSPSPRPPPKRRQFPRRTGRARSSSSPSSSPRRPHHANKLRRPPSPASRRERDRGFNGHSRMKQDSRGVHEDSRGGGGPRTRDGYSGRASSPPESGRYRESGSDFRGPPGRSHRVENRPHYNAPSYADRRVRRDYPPPPPRGGDYYGRREANAHSGYIRGGKVGSSARERRGGGYAYRAASPVVLRSRVEIPERNPSPSPSSEGSPMKSKRKASETPADAPASKHFRESPMERDVQKDGSGSSGAEGDIGKRREKRRKDKKDKKSKRSKKHKKHKKQKKSSKVHKHSSPSSSSGFSDKGGNAEDDKRIEELRKKALESMGKKAWEATGKRED